MQVADIDNRKAQLNVVIKKAEDEAFVKMLEDTYPSLYWALKYHKNSRMQDMDFTDMPYLSSLYMQFHKTPRMVVEKSVQCFPAGTLVVTVQGYKPIESLVVGDLVLTHNNRYREVTVCMSRDVVSERLVRLVADSANAVESTEDHPYLLYPYGAGKYHFRKFKSVFGKFAEWVSAGNISEGAFVVRPVIPKPDNGGELVVVDYVDRAVIREDSEWFMEKWGQRWTKKVISLNYDFGLLCGLYLAEGWVSDTRLCFGFHYNESNLEDIVRRVVGTLLKGKDSVHSYLNKSDTCRRVFVSTYTLTSLFKKLFGDRCECKQLPEWMLYTNYDFLKGVMDGVFAGDGNITNNQLRFTTTSETLAYQFKFIAAMGGVFGNVRQEVVKGKQVAYRFIAGHGVTYSRNVVVSESQSAVRVKKLSERYYTGKVYNISVQEDESYVAGDYIVHNCGLSEAFMVESHREAAMGLNVMYVLPKYEIRNRFVNNRIYKLHNRVPRYMELMKANKGSIHRTSLMHVGSGSIMFVGSNVESEFIEAPIDSAYVDEKDRCNFSNLLLLPDRYSASPYQYHREISNPTVEGIGIDERFLESSQGFWNIKCPKCGKYFVPDFFQHVVREVAHNTYEPRDIIWEPGKVMNLIHDCGAAVNRLAPGCWVHTWAGKEWTGVRISKLFNKTSRLAELYDIWSKAVGNDMKVQIFYNSNLGLPYTAAGAKISRGDLLRCERVYEYGKRNPMSTYAMGIDVGASLHYVVREVVREGGQEFFRLAEAGALPSFNTLSQKIKEWAPYAVVIDAMPEIHKVMDLKEEFRQVQSCLFMEGSTKITHNKDNRELRIDRTALLDYIKQHVVTETWLLPQGSEHLDGGAYYSHLTASTRLLEVNETNPEKSRYVWKASREDHYHFAEGYCWLALSMLPNSRLFEYFDRFTADVVAKDKESHGPNLDLTPEQEEEFNRLQAMDSTQVLFGLQRGYGKKPAK